VDVGQSSSCVPDVETIGPNFRVRPVVAALRFDSFRSAIHDIHDITDREPCERLAMHLHILRILQEAFTYCEACTRDQHTRRDRLDAAGEHVYIQVRDNGTGFSSECMGRGISSMRHRAKIIAAISTSDHQPRARLSICCLPVS